MLDDLKCKKCGLVMKKTPIKRLDSRIIIEYYCDNCDESITYYPDLDEIEKSRPSFF